MKEVKDRIVSYFSMPISNTAEQMILAKNPNFKGNIGNAYPLCSKTIGELMIEMTDPESKLKGLFNTIRIYQDKDPDIAKGFKKCVPYVLVTGEAEYRDTKHFDLSSFTWLLPFDIDKDENPDADWQALYDRIKSCDYVVFVGKSVRGKGIKGIIRLKEDSFDPKVTYTVSKQNINKYLNEQWNCILDNNQSKLVQPFYLTWDPDMYVNLDAKELIIDYSVTLVDIESSGEGEDLSGVKVKVTSLEKLLTTIRLVKIPGTRYETIGKNAAFIGGLFKGGVFPKTLKREKIIEELKKAVFANNFIPDKAEYAKWAETSFSWGEKMPITETDLKNSNNIERIAKMINSVASLDEKGKSKFIRVADDYFYIEGENQKMELYPRKRQTLIDDYTPKFLDVIPKYSSFCNEPDYFNYEREIKGRFNIAHPLAYDLKEGEFPTINHLFQHIFGEQKNLGIAYVQMGLIQPKHKLPVLCLVSKLNGTGKTTFINFMNRIFYGNSIIIGNDDIKSDFNMIYATKQWIMIDESKLEGHQITSRIKKMATQEDINLNEKFIGRHTIPFHGKIIILSNDERGFIEINKSDLRYWVVKVPEITVFDPNYLEKLEKEIPAFLYYLKNTELIYPEKKSRLWFDVKDLNTQALEEVKEYNKSPIYHQVIDKIEAWFLLHPDRDFLLTQARTIWEMDEFIKRNYSFKAIGRVLKEDFDGEWITKTTRFTDDLTGNKDIGKPWKIKNVNKMDIHNENNVHGPNELF